MTKRHECAIEDCDEAISPSLVMCPRHWRGVPAELRERVARSWKRRELAVWRKAVREARAAVEVEEAA